jgi:DNA-directed RNA polymerase sigma subunit (sigma70/sigma32)
MFEKIKTTKFWRFKMKEVVAVKTLAEKRLAFVDQEEYADRYISGTYDFIADMYAMKVAPKFKLEKIFDTLNRLTIKEELVIRYYYGIDRVRETIEQIATKFHMTTTTVKRILTNGRKQFMVNMAA